MLPRTGLRLLKLSKLEAAARNASALSWVQEAVEAWNLGALYVGQTRTSKRRFKLRRRPLRYLKHS